jgi:hypothetical protein
MLMEAIPVPKFELLKAQTVRNTESRDVTPGTLVQICRRFGSSCGLHTQCGRMLPDMKPIGFFETYISNSLHGVAFQKHCHFKTNGDVHKVLNKKLVKDSEMD